MILLDGPMGTELAARGVPTPGPAWSATALETSRDVVRAIHADYMHAGAMLHRTNTFRTQPRIFPELAECRSLIARAVFLARDAAPPPARIAGSIAPVFDCYRPDLSPPEEEARLAHTAVASWLAEEDVDLLVCETFPHAGEARVAVEVAVSTGLETWVALTAGPDGSLMTPEAMERAACDCVSAGAKAVLVCCTGARITQPYVDRLASSIGSRVPFGAYANAGDPVDGLGWDEEPARAAERYLAIAEGWRASGATIIGSCCGTKPAHIAALAATMLSPVR